MASGQQRVINPFVIISSFSIMVSMRARCGRVREKKIKDMKHK